MKRYSSTASLALAVLVILGLTGPVAAGEQVPKAPPDGAAQVGQLVVQRAHTQSYVPRIAAPVDQLRVDGCFETTILHPWHGRDLGRTSSEKQAVRAGIHLQGSPPGHLGEGEHARLRALRDEELYLLEFLQFRYRHSDPIRSFD